MLSCHEDSLMGPWQPGSVMLSSGHCKHQDSAACMHQYRQSALQSGITECAAQLPPSSTQSTAHAISKYHANCQYSTMEVRIAISAVLILPVYRSYLCTSQCSNRPPPSAGKVHGCSSFQALVH